MTSIATTVIVVGVLFTIAGWLGSPTKSARTSRKAIAPVLRDYPAYVYTALAIVVCIYFLSAPIQNLRSFLTTLIIAGMAAFGIHELRKETAVEFPDASYSEVFGRTKDRMVGAVKDANLGEKASKLRLPEKRKGGGEAAERGPDGNAPGRQRGRAPSPPRTTRRPAREGRPHRRGVRGREGSRAGRQRQVLRSARPAVSVKPASGLEPELSALQERCSTI